MSLRRTLCAVAIYVIVIGYARGANERPIMGAGANASCGAWLAQRQGTTSNHDLTHWAEGFLSGVDLYGDDLIPLNEIDADALFFWLDKHCAANPTQKFVRALKDFITEHPH